MTAGRNLSMLAILSLGLMLGCASSEPDGLMSLQNSNADVTAISHSIPASEFDIERPALITLEPNDNLLQIVNEAPGSVLIDFYADWCGPCKKQGKILHDMEQTAAAKRAIIVKVNVDQHGGLAQQFQVSSLPTLVLVKDGAIVERLSGVAGSTRVASLLSR